MQGYDNKSYSVRQVVFNCGASKHIVVNEAKKLRLAAYRNHFACVLYCYYMHFINSHTDNN